MRPVITPLAPQRMGVMAPPVTQLLVMATLVVMGQAVAFLSALGEIAPTQALIFPPALGLVRPHQVVMAQTAATLMKGLEREVLP